MTGLDKGWEDFLVMIFPYVLDGISAILVIIMVYLVVRYIMIRKFLDL